MSSQIIWNGKPLPFVQGETIAQALIRAGHRGFGISQTGKVNALFCGIGQCQNCLVIISGQGPREACQTLCRDGLIVTSVEVANAR